MLLAGDARLVLIVVAATLLCLVLLYGGLRALGHDPRQLLSPREWRVLGKGAALLFLGALLLLRLIYVELPAEMFIYGRF